MLLAMSSMAAAQGYDSGSDGSDGPLVVSTSLVINLAAATTGPWDMPSPVPGQGVYDPDRWAVVFKYTAVDIGPGAIVTFANHPSGAPVVWLASGDVTIEGTIDISGKDGTGNGGLPLQYAEPGPGGFQGGSYQTNIGLPESGGFGPGGGNLGRGGGSHVTSGSCAAGPVYADADSRMVIGGSGGSGYGPFASVGGGAGGGAIVIASTSSIMCMGTISAVGGAGGGGSNGTGGGSGGFIHLVADAIVGTLGGLQAFGGTGTCLGGDGRIRIEAVNLLAGGESDPIHTFGAPAPVFEVAPPVLHVISAGGLTVPVDPRAGVDTADVCFAGTSMTLQIAAANIPPGTAVTVFIKPAHGSPSTVTTPPLAGTFKGSSTSVNVTLPANIPVEIQLRANWCD
jgi:hypothetical protein